MAETSDHVWSWDFHRPWREDPLLNVSLCIINEGTALQWQGMNSLRQTIRCLLQRQFYSTLELSTISQTVNLMILLHLLLQIYL